MVIKASSGTITADNTSITADSTVVTADGYAPPVSAPLYPKFVSVRPKEATGPPPKPPEPELPRHERRFLPALAEAIAEWFPELGGRSLAVSEATITKENVPTLPLAMCALLHGSGNVKTQPRGQVGFLELEDTFVIGFWLEPERYKKANGTETPFWSYYPYDQIRETLFDNIFSWQGPHNERIHYQKTTIGADPHAVILTFQFVACFNWCPSLRERDWRGDGIIERVEFQLCTPKGVCIPDAAWGTPDEAA